ncbi:unnamed protein product [Pylaiella littoralis]
MLALRCWPLWDAVLSTAVLYAMFFHKIHVITLQILRCADRSRLHESRGRRTGPLLHRPDQAAASAMVNRSGSSPTRSIIILCTCSGQVWCCLARQKLAVGW